MNNRIEQDHRGIQRIVDPMMGFKNVEAAQATLSGIELHRMLRTGQCANDFQKYASMATVVRTRGLTVPEIWRL